MKKKFAVLAAITMFAFSTTFANTTNDPAPEKITQEFNREFKKANNITWEAKATFYKVSFNVNDQALEAFYSLRGELLGVSRNIVFNQLPLLLQKGIKEKYAVYWIGNLFESVTAQGTGYYLTLENAAESVTLRGSMDDWNVYSTTQKP